MLSSLAEVRDWAAYSRARGRKLAAAIHVDTGINRQGMPEYELHQLAAEPDLLATFETTLVMSHLACADEPDSPMNERQRERFNAMRALLPPAPASLSNSGGTFWPVHFDLVRRASRSTAAAHEGRPNPMRTVVRLAAKILQVHRVGPAPPSATSHQGAGPRASPPSRAAMPTGSCAP